MSVKTRSKRRSILPVLSDDRPLELISGYVLGIGFLAAMCVGVLAGSHFLIGIGAMMAGLLVLSRLRQDLRRGVSSSNWGSWRREENRGGFRGNVGFWMAIAGLWFALGLVMMCGVVEVPAWWYH